MRCRAPASAGEGSAEAAVAGDAQDARPRPLRRLARVARAGSRSRCLATSETGPTKMESLIRAPLVTDNHQQKLEGAAPLSKKASSNFPCYKSRAVIIITFTVRSLVRSYLRAPPSSNSNPTHLPSSCAITIKMAPQSVGRRLLKDEKRMRSTIKMEEN